MPRDQPNPECYYMYTLYISDDKTPWQTQHDIQTNVHMQSTDCRKLRINWNIIPNKWTWDIIYWVHPCCFMLYPVSETVFRLSPFIYLILVFVFQLTHCRSYQDCDCLLHRLEHGSHILVLPRWEITPQAENYKHFSIRVNITLDIPLDYRIPV